MIGYNGQIWSQPHFGQHQQVESLLILEAILRGLEAQIEKGRDDIIGIHENKFELDIEGKSQGGKNRINYISF